MGSCNLAYKIEYDGGYVNGRYGGFTFEDPLSEDENEDIHHAVEYSIFESDSAEMDFGESFYTEEDEHHTESIQGSMDHSDELMRQRKASMTPRKIWWRKLFSSLNIFKKFNQYDVISCESSTSKGDSNCQMGQVCDVCDEACNNAKGTKLSNNQILSNRRTIWGQTACSKHSSDGTTMCCCCRRFKIGDMRYISLSDGRKLCSDCHCTAIMDTETCIPLFHEVYRFLEGINMTILRDIPIFLVTEQAINKTNSGGKDHRESTLGKTTFRAEVVVPSVARAYQRGDNIYVEEEVQYIQRIHKVTCMLILYGYPRLAIGSTIAHEMVHAWIHTEGYKGLELEVEEGICEVMAHRWLDWYAFVGDDFLHTTPEQTQFLKNLKEVLKNKIETRHNEIYGGGFREAKWAIERYGLKYTLSHVAQTGNFPQHW